MHHPFTTAELVRQRRAALDAEARNQGLVRQLRAHNRAGPQSRRLVLAGGPFARRVRALLGRSETVPAASQPQGSRTVSVSRRILAASTGEQRARQQTNAE